MKKLAFLWIITIFLVSCGGNSAEQPEPQTTEIAEISQTMETVETTEISQTTETAETTEISQAIEATETTFTGERTREEYLEDLDYLYYILSNNFPFWGVIERRAGVNLRQLFADTRQHIETTPQIADDNAFFNLLHTNIFAPVGSLGHLGAISQNDASFFIAAYGSLYTLGDESLRPYFAIFDNPASRNFYNLTDEHFIFEEETAKQNMQGRQNLHTSITEPGRIAYVQIPTMHVMAIENDAIQLWEFFHEIADFEHLIVDIRGNPGGSGGYFPYVVMQPLMKETLTAQFYMMFSTHEHNMQFLEMRTFLQENGDFIDSEFLERLTHFNMDDLEYLDKYSPFTTVIEPIQQQKPMFDSKIWLVVDRQNFSAAENAAQVAQQTGFATIVGEPTGGDGIGIDPSMLALPNTGIVVRYSSIYGTDLLGRNNQEFGTTPDIELPQTGTLSALLEIIRTGDWQ